MESVGDRPSRESAAELLRSHEDVRRRVERQGQSRSLARLLLWDALVVALYSAMILFSVSNSSGDEVAASGGRITAVMLVFPFVFFTAPLLGGARERFSIRKKPSAGNLIAIGVAGAGFVTLSVLTVAEVGYPWWLNLLVVVVLFVTMAAAPIRQLRRTTPDSERWVNQPLRPPVRWTTMSIGVVAGVAAACSAQSWSSLTTALTMMVASVAVLVGWRTSWGLPRTGYEWGPIHWAAFAVATGVLFLLVLLLSRTDWITTPLAITVGALVFCIMFLASVLPLRAQRD